jgi:hypothetical protein
MSSWKLLGVVGMSLVLIHCSSDTNPEPGGGTSGSGQSGSMGNGNGGNGGSSGSAGSNTNGSAGTSGSNPGAGQGGAAGSSLNGNSGSSGSGPAGTAGSSGTGTMGTAGTSGSATGGSSGGTDFVALNDGFDGASLNAKWQVLHPELVTISVQNSALNLVPAMSVWYQGNQGPMLYQSVTGDFKVTAHVHVRSESSPNQPPATPFRLAGLSARNPNGTNGEDYVFVVLGADDNDLSTEYKSTDNSQSSYQGPTWSYGPDAELRLCRQGQQFTLLVRPPNQTWQELHSYARPDLPAALDVGPVVYANTNPPDLRATFDDVIFTDSTNCMAD